MSQYINPASKLFGHLDRLHAIKRGERPAPVNVEMFLTNRCSHGCSWCHYAYTHTRGPLAGKVPRPPGAINSGDVMDLALGLRAIAQLKAAGVESVTFSGGGEPTLHPHFDELVGAVANSGMKLGLYSHGGHINKERAALLKQKASWVYISLDECTAESFQASKGVLRFEAVLQGIRNLVAAEGDAQVGIGFLIHDGNWRDIHEMVRLGRSLGADYVQFRPTVKYEQDAPGELSEDTAWTRHATGRLNAYKGDKFVIADTSRFEMYANWRGHGYDTCYGSALQTVISPNGMMWRCTTKTEHPDALLGDLSIESFADAWARSGGPCAVTASCRIMCKQHLANITLDKVMEVQPHAEFI